MALVEGDALGWWDFEEGSGTTVADEISTSPTNLSLFSTPTWVTGGPSNIPNGVDFNGTSQYARAAKDYDFSSSEGSLSVWLNADNVTTLAAIADLGNLGGEASLFLLNGLLYGRSRYTSDRQVSSAVSTTTLYHAVWAFKSGDMELYINGSSVGTSTATGTLSDDNSNFTIARRSVTAGSYLNGRIFQACLFNRRITTAEVGELYNSGAGTTYNGLFGGGGGYRYLPQLRPFAGM